MMDLRLDRYFVANNVAKARDQSDNCLTSPNLPASAFIRSTIRFTQPLLISPTAWSRSNR